MTKSVRPSIRESTKKTVSHAEALQQSPVQSNFGQAAWKDVATFVEKYFGASSVEGFSALKFKLVDKEVVEAPVAIDVYSIESKPYVVGDTAGMPVSWNHEKALPLGLNLPFVASAIRQHGLPERTSNVAVVRSDETLFNNCALPSAALIFARQRVRPMSGRYVEDGLSLHVSAVDEVGARWLDPEPAARLVRAAVNAIVVREPQIAPSLAEAVKQAEQACWSDLRRPTSEERESEVRAAVFPIAVVVFARTGPGV